MFALSVVVAARERGSRMKQGGEGGRMSVAAVSMGEDDVEKEEEAYACCSFCGCCCSPAMCCVSAF